MKNEGLLVVTNTEAINMFELNSLSIPQASIIKMNNHSRTYQNTQIDPIVKDVSNMIHFAETKNFVTSQLNKMTKKFRKQYQISITDYTKYPLSYLYFQCSQINNEKFWQVLPQFFSSHPEHALSFIANTIYSDITFSIPQKVLMFSKEEISKIWLLAAKEVLLHKHLCAFYIQQFSVHYRTINSITDNVVKQFVISIIKKYKDIFIDNFRHSRMKMLALFAAGYPYFNANDINKVLVAISSGQTDTIEFFHILDTMNVQGLNIPLINKIKAKCFLRGLAAC